MDDEDDAVLSAVVDSAISAFLDKLQCTSELHEVEARLRSELLDNHQTSDTAIRRALFGETL